MVKYTLYIKHLYGGYMSTISVLIITLVISVFGVSILKSICKDESQVKNLGHGHDDAYRINNRHLDENCDNLAQSSNNDFLTNPMYSSLSSNIWHESSIMHSSSSNLFDNTIENTMSDTSLSNSWDIGSID